MNALWGLVWFIIGGMVGCTFGVVFLCLLQINRED